jgi:hypothetical protein
LINANLVDEPLCCWLEDMTDCGKFKRLLIKLKLEFVIAEFVWLVSDNANNSVPE